jgi:hypothetical protein
MNTLGKCATVAAGLVLLCGLSWAKGKSDGGRKERGGESHSSRSGSSFSTRSKAPSITVKRPEPRAADKFDFGGRTGKLTDGAALPRPKPPERPVVTPERRLPTPERRIVTPPTRTDDVPVVKPRPPEETPDLRLRKPEPNVEKLNDRDGTHDRDDRGGHDGDDGRGGHDRDDDARRRHDHDDHHNHWWPHWAPWWARPTVAFYTIAPRLIFTECLLDDGVVFRQYSYSYAPWGYWYEAGPFWAYGYEEWCGTTAWVFPYRPYVTSGFSFSASW